MASLLFFLLFLISLSSATPPSPSPSPSPSGSPSPSPSPSQSPFPSPSQSPSQPEASSSAPSPSTLLADSPSLSPSTSPISKDGMNAIQKACSATRFPNVCQSSLSKQIPPNPNPLQILQASISVSLQNLKKAESMVQSIQNAPVKNEDHKLVAKNCLEVLTNSYYRISSANDVISNYKKIKDARAWASAALAFQHACRAGLQTVNGSKLIDETAKFMDSVVDLTSNALCIMGSYDLSPNDTESWGPPKTERDGFWPKATGDIDVKPGTGPKYKFPHVAKPNSTVCKDLHTCDHKVIQDAVNAVPDNGTEKYVIRVEEGLYEERVMIPLWKKNVVFWGDGINKTIITGHLNVDQHGISTYNTATVAVLGDGFMAINLTIENSAGLHNPNASQAVAFRSDSDKSYIENVKLVGFQDTLYSHTLRQFYKSCQIHGTVDFICGSSAAVFQDCEIIVEPRLKEPEKGETNVVTAHGRTDPAQSTGFVFENCTIKGSLRFMSMFHKNPIVHKNYLGRPWKEYSRTLFIRCKLDALISPQGWMLWEGDFALKTLYYGEFKSFGRGASPPTRVPWSNQIPPEHVNVYSIPNFIQGDQWIPTSS